MNDPSKSLVRYKQAQGIESPSLMEDVPRVDFWQIILGVLAVCVLVVLWVTGWQVYLKLPAVVQVLIALLSVFVVISIVGSTTRKLYSVYHHIRDTEETLHAREDARLRTNKLVDAETERIKAEALKIRAEAQKLLLTVDFDDQGNAARHDPVSGQIIQIRGNMREHPALSSIHSHNSMTASRPEESGKVIVTPVIFPEPRNFADVLTRWRPSWHGIYLMDTINGNITVPGKDVCHVGLGGPTGGGKTNTTRLLTAQILASGASVYLASPNYAPVKLNGNHLEDWRPIAAYLKEPPAREPREIENLLHRFIDLLNKRRANEQISPRRGKDLFLALGEWPAIVATIDDAPELLGRLLREARQYGIHIIAEFQDALINTIGGNSGVRENYRTAYYFGGDQKTAKILLDLDNKTKIDENGLGKLGAAYLRSQANTACPGRVPWLSNQALYMLLGRPIDPVTDETILDESEVPEAFQSYVVGGSFAEPYGTPEMKRFYSVPGQSRLGTKNTVESHFERSTGALPTMPMNESVERSEMSAERVPELKPYGPEDLMMDKIQIEQFVALYQQLGNIADSLSAIKNDKGQGLGRRYFTHASNIVKERKLRRS